MKEGGACSHLTDEIGGACLLVEKKALCGRLIQSACAAQPRRRLQQVVL